MQVKAERCELCRWFRPLEHSQAEPAHGGCRFNAPEAPGGFPLVSRNDWCSHWSAITAVEAGKSSNDPVVRLSGYGHALHDLEFYGHGAGLVEKLRNWRGYDGPTELLDSAADKITALTAEVEQMIKEREWLWGNCKVIYFHPGHPLSEYPIEHNPHASINGRQFIEPIMRAAITTN